MHLKIKNNINWVGIKDWELQKFHGNEYSINHGSTYNSYLVKEEKIVLIDTVWKPFAKDFVKNLEKEIDLDKIDYIITNHAEIDHSGALPELMAKIPNTPIYCTKNGIKSLKGHYHEDWDFHPVKTGDILDIGNGKQLVFVEMRMLHWPDSMAVYLTEDNVLFSNDAFGQHYATSAMFNDLVDQAELFQECIKYYANILTPFNTFAQKKINEILAMNLPIDVIAPSHGVIWRDNPTQIVLKYLEWSKDYQENQITLLYDTMWEGTRIMADKIAEGIKKADGSVKLVLLNTSKGDKNDIITEIFKSKAILVGSPTINKGILSSMAEIIEIIKGLNFINKKVATFGCYGWSGESVQVLNSLFDQTNFTRVSEGLKILWNPDTDAIKKCIQFGEEFVKLIKT
ncbi:anaerobic nitric oxide reductase flavorubredoxin [Candidatus Lokiarchaeum ossiferum]|uniref:anaerobic nitric oxide reductase flavorubredoxin n=1 Tax=Candidatus Lokiarchaeum ossiferum TaxID=2951803 RepID=UPI00352FDB5B